MDRARQQDVSAPRGGGRLRRRRLLAAGAVAALALGSGTAVAATGVITRNPGQLTLRGPVNTVNGFPAWYQDSSNRRLELCLDDTNPYCGFLPGDVPDPDAPITFPGNFPEEAFYFLAGAEIDLPGGGKAVLTTGLEAAFANAVQHGDQMVFGRVRIVVKGAPRNSTLTFDHPYGQAQIDTDANGAGRLVEDIGASVGGFDEVVKKGNVGPFLVASGGPVSDGEGGTYVGNPDLTTTVTGGPHGNAFRLSGGGLDLSTDSFTLMGKIATNRGVDAQSAVVSEDGVLDVFASSGGDAVEVVGQSGFPTTGMRTDPGSDRYYARIPFTGPAPASVTVRNITDKPASTASTAVDTRDVLVTSATYDGAEVTVAATSRSGGTLTVAGLGELESGSSRSFAVLAPPATVTVSRGSSRATSPVVVTGGKGTTPLPPVPPSTEVDPTPGGDTSTSTGGTVTPDPSSPTRPAQLTAPTGVAGVGEVTVSWEPSPAASAVTGYRVQAYRAGVAVGAPVPAEGASATVSGLAAGTGYTFTVTAVNAVGDSPASPPSAVVTPVDALTVTAARWKTGDLRVEGTGTSTGATVRVYLATATGIGAEITGTTASVAAPVAPATVGTFGWRLRTGVPATNPGRIYVRSNRGGVAGPFPVVNG